MTNAEYFLKEGIEDRQVAKELSKHIIDNIVIASSNDRNLERKKEIVRAVVLQFFTKIRKPTLTEDERVILRSIDEKYKIICRENKNIWIKENNDGIRIYHGYCLDYYNLNLFQFIKERRRI